MASSKKSSRKPDLHKRGDNSGSGIFILILCCFFISGFTGLILLIYFPHWDRKMLSIGRYPNH